MLRASQLLRGRVQAQPRVQVVRTLSGLRVVRACATPSGPEGGEEKKEAPRSRKGKTFEHKRRRRGRPAHLRSPDDSPLRDGNRDRLIGLLTERATKTLMCYLSETNLNLYHWLLVYTKENPIPKNGNWDEVSGEEFLRKLLSMPVDVAKYDVGRDPVFDNFSTCGVDPRNIAQRIMEIRSQLAVEFVQDLSQVAEENTLLLRESLHASLSQDPAQHPVIPYPLPPGDPASPPLSKPSKPATQPLSQSPQPEAAAGVKQQPPRPKFGPPRPPPTPPSKVNRQWRQRMDSDPENPTELPPIPDSPAQLLSIIAQRGGAAQVRGLQEIVGAMSLTPEDEVPPGADEPENKEADASDEGAATAEVDEPTAATAHARQEAGATDAGGQPVADWLVSAPEQLPESVMEQSFAVGAAAQEQALDVTVTSEAVEAQASAAAVTPSQSGVPPLHSDVLGSQVEAPGLAFPPPMLGDQDVSHTDGQGGPGPDQPALP